MSSPSTPALNPTDNNNSNSNNSSRRSNLAPNDADTLADLDPLSSTPSPIFDRDAALSQSALGQGLSTPPPTLGRRDTIGPLTFKRRATTSNSNRIGNLFDSLLSRGGVGSSTSGGTNTTSPIKSTNPAGHRASSLSSSMAPSGDAPRRISLPPNAFDRPGYRDESALETSDTGEELGDDDEDDGQRTPTQFGTPASQSGWGGQNSINNREGKRKFSKGPLWLQQQQLGIGGAGGRNWGTRSHAGSFANSERRSIIDHGHPRGASAYHGSTLGDPIDLGGKNGGGGGGGGGDQHPSIPAVIPNISTPQYSTPLPTIPIVVLCICMLGEFLSASVSGPFLFFMIEGFGVGQGPGGGGEATVGFWAGIVSACFFLTQFMTSLLWSSVAEKHGRRAVLFVSLLGNAITLVLFGMSENLGMAICIRLGQGIFNGSVGVARGAVRDITDASNEGRAYTLMGFCWGMGGIVGPIIGGLLEHPAKNYPGIFGKVEIFIRYPYLLPCLVAGSMAGTGCFLSLFLGWDGGVRTGRLQLQEEKTIDSTMSAFSGNGFRNTGSLTRNLANRISGYLSSPSRNSGGGDLNLSRTHTFETSANVNVGSSAVDPERNPLAISRTSTRQSGVVGYGSAYGYEPRFHSRQGRRNTGRSVYRSASIAPSTQYAPDYDDLEHSDKGLNFAQRLLLANEDAVFSISDLWVAAATQNDDQYSVADYAESVFENDDEGESRAGDADQGFDQFGYEDREAGGSTDDLLRPYEHLRDPRTNLGLDPDLNRGRRESRYSVAPSVDRHSRLLSPRPPNATGTSPNRGPSGAFSASGRPGMGQRRASATSSVRVPAIFENTGLSRTPPILSPNIGTAERTGFLNEPSASTQTPLTAIPERGAAPDVRSPAARPAAMDAPVAEKKSSGLSQLPISLIAQYALLALHGTTCDQVFMSFLVTPVVSGGLGLTASHYAELVAVMCLCQMFFQFRFYPTVGPPLGKLSHLSMFRLGLLCYIPSYLLFPLLRSLLHERGNGLVMFGMVILSAGRYLGNTCSYTAVMVLTNAMTPPHLIPLANGLAQSAVSAARFCGPVLGGILWSYSITGGPDARPYPFNYALGFVVIAIVCALGFLHSFRIR